LKVPYDLTLTFSFQEKGLGDEVKEEKRRRISFSNGGGSGDEVISFYELNSLQWKYYEKLYFT
jgi:hypothetical protein